MNTRSLTAGLTGVQRYTAELCARLAEKIAKVSPVKPLQGVNGHLWEQLRLPALLNGRLLWSPANSGPLIVRHQVVTIHDIAVLDHPEWFNPRFVAWYRWITPRLVRRAARVITVSEFTKRRVVDVTGVDKSRVAVVANGVDECFKPRPPQEAAAVRHKLGLPSSDYVLSLATLEPRKNLRGQLAAWARCVAHVPEKVWLVISGARGKDHIFGGVNVDDLPPRVHLTGYVPDQDLPALYSGAMALLYPSFYEGFGLPVLEAMAAGTVPLVSHATAPEEVAGDAGVAVDPYSRDSMASAIVRIIKDASWRECLRQRGLQRSKIFSWQRSADSTWKEIDTAVRYSLANSAPAVEPS